MLRQPNSSLSETVRLIRSAITFSHATRPPKVVMVTSAVPREGKTTFAMMMARLSAASGKRVLIIEADMRRPSFMQELREKVPAMGLTEYLRGKATIDEVIGIDKASGAHFIVVREPTSPAELLVSPQMMALLAEARQRYDLVVLDTPPAAIVADAVELAHGGAVDAAVLLVKWNTTPAHLVQDALSKLRAANVPLLGTVLTQVNLRRYATFGEGRLPYQYAKSYYSEV
jgi:capsular exopolysaccharide synthesis family protein